MTMFKADRRSELFACYFYFIREIILSFKLCFRDLLLRNYFRTIRSSKKKDVTNQRLGVIVFVCEFHLCMGNFRWPDWE